MDGDISQLEEDEDSGVFGLQQVGKCSFKPVVWPSCMRRWGNEKHSCSQYIALLEFLNTFHTHCTGVGWLRNVLTYLIFSTFYNYIFSSRFVSLFTCVFSMTSALRAFVAPSDACLTAETAARQKCAVSAALRHAEATLPQNTAQECGRHRCREKTDVHVQRQPPTAILCFSNKQLLGGGGGHRYLGWRPLLVTRTLHDATTFESRLRLCALQLTRSLDGSVAKPSHGSQKLCRNNRVVPSSMHRQFASSMTKSWMALDLSRVGTSNAEPHVITSLGGHRY